MDEQTATSDSSKQSKLIACLVVGFALFHCATLLLAVLPEKVRINRLVEPYRKLTGSQQRWDMFSTIPNAQDREVSVEIVDAAGKKTIAGPILPGLEEFDLESRIRYHPMLHRLLAREGDYLGSYLGKLEAAVVESAGGDTREFSLVSETDFIRLIKRVDEDGQMTVRKREMIGPIEIVK